MDRQKKIERILTLQAKVHQLSEWRLAGLDREQSALDENRDRLFAALNNETPLQGLFVEAMARRLAALARDGERLARAREAAHRRLQEEGLRLKRIERTATRVRRQSFEEERRRGFALLLDALASVGDASLP